MEMANEHWMRGKSTLQWIFLEITVVVFLNESIIVTLYSNLFDLAKVR
jgi:hypothetical protein